MTVVAGTQVAACGSGRPAGDAPSHPYRPPTTTAAGPVEPLHLHPPEPSR